MKNFINEINKKHKKLNNMIIGTYVMLLICLLLIGVQILVAHNVKKEVIKTNKQFEQNINNKIDIINKNIANNSSNKTNTNNTYKSKYVATNGDTDVIVCKYCKKYNVDPKLVKAIIHVETRGVHNTRSKSGAIGIMQLTPTTAKAFGVNPYNKEENIHGGVKYLSYLNKKFNNDSIKVIASYNAGETAVLRHNGVPPYKETQNYVAKVLKAKENMV